MKTALLLSALALLSTASLAASDGSTVTLEVTLGHPAAPAYRSCALDVPTPTTAAAVLDAAVAEGCIDSWSHDEFPGYGRYVTCIDGVCAVPGTFWAFYLDGAFAQGGIDNSNGQATVEAGGHVEFAYRDWFSGLAA